MLLIIIIIITFYVWFFDNFLDDKIIIVKVMYLNAVLRNHERLTSVTGPVNLLYDLLPH